MAGGEDVAWLWWRLSGSCSRTQPEHLLDLTHPGPLCCSEPRHCSRTRTGGRRRTTRSCPCTACRRGRSSALCSQVGGGTHSTTASHTQNTSQTRHQQQLCKIHVLLSHALKGSSHTQTPDCPPALSLVVSGRTAGRDVNGDSWFQFENANWAPLSHPVESAVHAVNYIQYKLSGAQVRGTTERSCPLLSGGRAGKVVSRRRLCVPSETSSSPRGLLK